MVGWGEKTGLLRSKKYKIDTSHFSFHKAFPTSAAAVLWQQGWKQRNAAEGAQRFLLKRQQARNWRFSSVHPSLSLCLSSTPLTPFPFLFHTLFVSENTTIPLNYLNSA